MWKKIVIAGATLLLAACSANGSHSIPTKVEPMASAYDSVKLVVVPQAADSTEVLEDLKAAVAGQILAGGRFRRVAVAGDEADVVVTVKITGYARVTLGERLLVGVLAGRNRVETQVTVTDGHTQQVLRAYQANGESAAHTMSGEAGTSDAVREAAKEIALGLVG